MDHDVVITTGGVSVGDRDHVRAALAAAGVELELWKVAMKPGKPFSFGMNGRVPVFGLPGNPVSTFVAFELFVRPALLAMQGATVTQRPRAPVQPRPRLSQASRPRALHPRARRAQRRAPDRAPASQARLGDAVVARRLQRARRARRRRDRDPAEHRRHRDPPRGCMSEPDSHRRAGDEGRVDKALARHFPDAGRRQLAELFDDGRRPRRAASARRRATASPPAT